MRNHESYNKDCRKVYRLYQNNIEIGFYNSILEMFRDNEDIFKSRDMINYMLKKDGTHRKLIGIFIKSEDI